METGTLWEDWADFNKTFWPQVEIQGSVYV